MANKTRPWLHRVLVGDLTRIHHRFLSPQQTLAESAAGLLESAGKLHLKTYQTLKLIMSLSKNYFSNYT